MQLHISPDLLLALDMVTRAAALPLGIEVVRRLRDAYIDRSYGCLTRVGLEQRWTGRGVVLFFDINRMGELNDLLTYEGVNARIRAALAETCRRGEAVAARWASGDELLIWLEIAPELLPVVEARLVAALARQGIDAEMAPATAERDLVATVKRASDQVQELKRRRTRAAAA